MCRYLTAHAAVLIAAFTATAYGQNHPGTPAPEMETDRSDITESTVVVPKGSMQIEPHWIYNPAPRDLGISRSKREIGLAVQDERGSRKSGVMPVDARCRHRGREHYHAGWRVC